MLIRINLLPTRQVKKREMGKQMLVLFAAFLVLGLVLNFLWYQARGSIEAENARKLEATKAEIANLEKAIGEVNNINKRRTEVKAKLAVLEDLRKKRGGPVRMMDALATAMPKKVWLKDFDEKSNAVKLTGTAVSHEDVADFMRSLGNIVWTPKGMGRMVEQKAEAKTSRVELIASDGAIEDFPIAEVGYFFTNIELKKAEQHELKVEGGLASKSVDFEIMLSANYAT